MGFRKPSLEDAVNAIRTALSEIRSPYNDGYVQMYCKRDLYLLKCWLNEQYDTLHKFPDEDQWAKEWEKEKVIQILKRNQ